MTTDRANPFANLDELPKFEPKPKNAPPMARQEQIEQLAEASGFPSRQPVQRTPASSPRSAGRRYKTGRNQQINIKATSQVIERLYKMADARRVPLGQLLEQALDALERK
jgi:hypothetical protein